MPAYTVRFTTPAELRRIGEEMTAAVKVLRQLGSPRDFWYGPVGPARAGLSHESGPFAVRPGRTAERSRGRRAAPRYRCPVLPYIPLDAARSLLAEHPEREPSTRELYEAAGVAAPTLYHHFGTKDGLLEAVVEEAFSSYLERKRGVPRTGDLLTDFAAGWDMHVGFGVDNPVLYALMYGRVEGRRSQAAQTAEAELRRGLEQLADAGLPRLGVDEAIAVTTAMAIGYVTQLTRGGGLPPVRWHGRWVPR